MEKAVVRVERIDLATEMEKRVALATVRLGEVEIRGVGVWKSPRGKLRVYVPSHRTNHGFEDAISLPSHLQAEVDAAVISAYKEELDKEIEANPRAPAQDEDKVNHSKEEGARSELLTSPRRYRSSL